MASTENEYYLRSILLLTEGGSYISKKVLYREVNKNGGDLDVLLKPFERKFKHQLHNRQCEKLFPTSGTTKVEKWDLQMVISVVQVVFRKSLSLEERKNLRILMSNRHEVLAHNSSASLDEDEYKDLQEQLKDAITKLAIGFGKDVKDKCSEYIEQFESGPIDIKSATEKKQMLQVFQEVLAATEDFEKRVMTRLNGFNHDALQKKTKVSVETVLKVCGASDYMTNLMESKLNEIFNEANETTQGDFDELKITVGKFLQIIRSKANFKGSTLKCVVLMFECTTYADLQWLLVYFNSSAYRQELKKIATSLETRFHTDEQVDISSTVTLECLQDIFRELDNEYDSEVDLLEESKHLIKRKINMHVSQGESDEEAEKSKGLQLALECTSLDELRHVWNLFHEDGATEHLNKIADALSEHFGVHVSLTTHLDIDKFKAAIEETVGHRVFEIQEDKRNIDASNEKQIFDEASRGNDENIPTERREHSSKDNGSEKMKKINYGGDGKSSMEKQDSYSKDIQEKMKLVDTRRLQKMKIRGDGMTQFMKEEEKMKLEESITVKERIEEFKQMQLQEEERMKLEEKRMMQEMKGRNERMEQKTKEQDERMEQKRKEEFKQMQLQGRNERMEQKRKERKKQMMKELDEIRMIEEMIGLQEKRMMQEMIEQDRRMEQKRKEQDERMEQKMKAISKKTLQYLGGSARSTPRLIVAAKYLNDGRLLLIDRNNSVLLITNTNDEKIQEIDLARPDKTIKPSDVNNGFDDEQLLITYTGKDFSLGVIFTTKTQQNETVLENTLTVKVMDRTRSIVVLDKDHFCATTATHIAILNKSGETGPLHQRSKKDRGGLLMSDRVARFFFGDGDEYVGCHWDGKKITEIFRFSNPRMKFPRGSVIDGSGRIIVCCDSSHNIFRISPDGKQSEVIVFDGTKSFGDVDFHPNGKFFVTTFWNENEWPILFKIEV